MDQDRFAGKGAIMDEFQAGSLEGFGKRLREQHGNEVGNLPDDMMSLLQTLDEIPYEQADD